jgi:hypothetical protein
VPSNAPFSPKRGIFIHFFNVVINILVAGYPYIINVCLFGEGSLRLEKRKRKVNLGQEKRKLSG